MSLLEELRRNRMVFLASSGASVSQEANVWRADLGAVETPRPPASFDAGRAAQPPVAPPQAGQAGGSLEQQQDIRIGAVMDRDDPLPLSGATATVEQAESIDSPQRTYSLDSPHDVEASVLFPEVTPATTPAATPDAWNVVLRQLETEARFRPQAFAEEEYD